MKFKGLRTTRSIFTLLIAASMVAGCGSQPDVAPQPEVIAKPAPAKAPPSTYRHTGDRAARIALDQLGTPYRYGGSSPSGFDCSGLVQYSYSRAGLALPRTTQALWNDTQTVAARDMRVGDLLFFSIDGKMSHVGMYIGNRKFVHAPSSGKYVSVANLDSGYYRNRLLRVGRP
ncbi:MAG: C40 family peptidase [Pseudomonadota bacterium]